MIHVRRRRRQRRRRRIGPTDEALLPLPLLRPPRRQTTGGRPNNGIIAMPHYPRRAHRATAELEQRRLVRQVPRQQMRHDRHRGRRQLRVVNGRRQARGGVCATLERQGRGHHRRPECHDGADCFERIRCGGERGSAARRNRNRRRNARNGSIGERTNDRRRKERVRHASHRGPQRAPRTTAYPVKELAAVVLVAAVVRLIAVAVVVLIAASLHGRRLCSLATN